ncbi:MAG: class I SAM-dependent methyltransferase [Chloroflexi bacterium]|nr:class I SAM-dependent methyltransferase [Chloroflexota bacterium]
MEFIAGAVAEFAGAEGLGLDVGCGRGSVSHPLAALGYGVIGVDIELRVDGTVKDGRLAFVLSDAQSLPFAAETYGFVVCSEVLEHLPHPERALEEAFRVLKGSGCLIVTVPNGYGPYELLFHHLRDAVARFVRRLRSSGEVGGHVQAFTLAGIGRLVDSNGFVVVRAANADFLSWLPLLRRWRWLGRLDCWMAERLPSALAGGYFLLCRKRDGR